MKPLLLVAALALSGCNVARFTHSSLPQIGDTAARHTVIVGEPGSFGWQPLEPGQLYARFVHDPSLDGGCNEWANEPTAELNNARSLCTAVVP